MLSSLSHMQQMFSKCHQEMNDLPEQFGYEQIKPTFLSFKRGSKFPAEEFIMDHTVSHCYMESLKMIVSLQIDSLGSSLNILTGEGSGLDDQMIYSSFNISNASSLIRSSGLHLRNRLFETSRGQPHTSCDEGQGQTVNFSSLLRQTKVSHKELLTWTFT